MSYVDAVVIAACVRRPIRFVMDHRIFRVPLLSFIFRTMRTIPIAPAKEDPAHEGARLRAGGRGARGGRDRRHLSRRASSPRRASSIRSGPASQQIVADDTRPGRADGAAGLWGSFFSRASNGKAMRRWRGIFSRIALVAAPPVPPERVTLEGLQATVLALRVRK